MAARPQPQGLVTVLMQAEDRDLREMMTKMEAALDPVAVAAWLGLTVDPYLRKRARERFAKEGDDVTGKWEALTGATQHIRASQGYAPAHPINHRTGAMEANITGAPNRLVAHGLGATLTLPGKPAQGKMRKKVKTAQRGSLAPLTPARPVLGVNEQDLTVVLVDLSLYLALGQFK